MDSFKLEYLIQMPDIAAEERRVLTGWHDGQLIDHDFIIENYQSVWSVIVSIVSTCSGLFVFVIRDRDWSLLCVFTFNQKNREY